MPPERIVRRGKATTTGRWVSPGRAVRAPNCSTTGARSTAAEGGPAMTRTVTWSSGTSSSCSSSGVRAPARTTTDPRRPAGEEHRHRLGLERMASILQGVDNLYEIDEVRPILERAAELTGKRYGAHSGHVASESHPDDVRLRVIADHVRTALMLIGDGVTPTTRVATCCAGSCGGRSGRSGCWAARIGRCPSCCRWPGTAWRRRTRSWRGLRRIPQYAYAEEDAFLSTLRAGTTILDTAIAETRTAGGPRCPGRRRSSCTTPTASRSI